MSYTVTACTLEPLQDDGNTIFLTPYDLQSEIGVFSFGDYLRLSMSVTSASINYSVGQRFMFNPCLFAPSAGAAAFPLGIGWLIEVMDITGTGVFDVQLVTGNAQGDITHQNVRAAASLAAANVMVVELHFYAAQDIYTYITNTMRSNRNTLQTAALGQLPYDNTAQSVWRNPSAFLEFVIYEADADYQPSMATYTDPYARNPATPYQKHNSYEVAGQFLDNAVGATQAWAGTALIKNNLSELTSVVAGIKFAGQVRRPAPQLSNTIDRNFTVAQDEDQLIIGAQNDVRIEIAAPTFVPDYVVIRLWRVDNAALLSAQPFVGEYAIKWAKMNTNATAYPNALSGDGVFSSPSVLTLGDHTILQFKINGNYIAANAQYRIWVGMYDSTSRASSSHISTPLRTGTSATPTLTIVGNTQLYDYEYPNANNVTVSEYERFRSAITLQGATYSFAGGFSAFLSQLQRVGVEINDGTNILASGSYDVVNGASTGDLAVMLDISGTNYTFSADFRAPSGAAVPIATALNVVFTPLFRVPNANGSFDLLTIRFAQTIYRNPENPARIVSVRFLDYSEYQIGNIVPVDTFCADTSLYVVEAELDAVPLNATLQAYAIFGAQNGSETVYEEESYASAYLPQLAAPQLSNVDAVFGLDKKAYFTLDISRFPSNAIFTAIGVNAVDF